MVELNEDCSARDISRRTSKTEPSPTTSAPTSPLWSIAATKLLITYPSVLSAPFPALSHHAYARAVNFAGYSLFGWGFTSCKKHWASQRRDRLLGLYWSHYLQLLPS